MTAEHPASNTCSQIELVGVRDIGDFEIGDDREFLFCEFLCDGQPAGKDERVADLYGINMGSARMSDLASLFRSVMSSARISSAMVQPLHHCSD